jgi:hypothetical protein
MSMRNLFSILDFGPFGFAQDGFWIGIENRKSKIQNEQPSAGFQLGYSPCEDVEFLDAENESDARRREASRRSVHVLVREDARLK